MRCMGRSGGATPRSNCARANGCVLPLRVVSCESSTAWTIRGRTLFSCAEANAARMSSKRTTCEMRARATGAGCMDFSGFGVPAHGDRRTAVARPRPVDAKIDGVGECTHGGVVRIRSVEVLARGEHAHEQEGGVDRGELDLLEAPTALHVEEVIVEAAIPGDVGRLR